ncbi:MAG: magnesium/cobalt transporter CorA [Paludibacter sp.]|jgi:magnesium transporter|nr:magnesium/cobalt transporter CorA [Paludibacter sp.]
MSRLIKNKKEHIGLSPYALVFRGQKKTEKILLRTMDFDLEDVRELEIKSPNELLELKKSKKLSWLNIDGLDNAELMQDVSSIYKIENNILSDVMNPSIRPKVQEFETGIFVTIKMLQYVENEDNLAIENLSLIITDNTLISFQEQPGDAFEPIRERIRKHKNKIRTSGSDYLAFALLDVVVDNYIYIIGILGEKIEGLEEDITNDPDKKLLDNINSLKRELNFLRKNIKPAKEMIINLAKLQSEFIQDDNRIHFKELQDNINEASELSDSYREILYDQLNIYHSSMSTKLNEIMRVLTVFSVIFIPLTFIVGVYGTNFENLPELHWKHGYFIMWGVMVMTTLIMLWYFRRKKWF